MREVSKDDKLFYFEKHFFTLDGLWMIETEKVTDWETALKIDTRVWIRLLRIIVRRVMKHLNIETNTLKDLIEVLTFRWSVENWDYNVEKNTDSEAIITINKCPYNSIMIRNPERHDKIPLICKDMCIPFYKEIVKEFNPEIKVKRNRYMGLGDSTCDFTFKQME